MKSKKIIRIIFYVIIGALLLLPTTSKADTVVLQANGGTPATYTQNDWLLYIRQMQAAGGALGLNDTINGTNLTSENKNLDIHMEKNTEYGAMAILSASSYGKPDKVNDGETTTGNSTGIKININSEWMSAGYSVMNVNNFKNATIRYKNTYTSEGGKVGDAIDIGKWHGANNSKWIHSLNREVSGLLRSREVSIFSYYGSNDNDNARVGRKNATRAVVVCGSGV